MQVFQTYMISVGDRVLILSEMSKNRGSYGAASIGRIRGSHGARRHVSVTHFHEVSPVVTMNSINFRLYQRNCLNSVLQGRRYRYTRDTGTGMGIKTSIQ